MAKSSTNDISNSINLIKLDIDGLPLSSSHGVKKFDLKSILRHELEEYESGLSEDEEKNKEINRVTNENNQHDVEILNKISDFKITAARIFNDSDYDYEEHESDLEGISPENCNEQNKASKKSSIKMHYPIESLTGDQIGHDGDRHVIFADCLGLSLADVRNLKNMDEPPNIPRSALKDLPNAKVKKYLRPEDRIEIKLKFQQPGCDWQFRKRVQQEKICLDNCIPCDYDLTISGVIAISESISTDCKVLIRYTLDSWQTYSDLNCHFMPSENDAFCSGEYRKYIFSIKLQRSLFASTESPCGSLEFALTCIELDKTSYWDSNKGLNYAIEFFHL